MKKIIPIFIISLLIFSGCGATAIQPNTSGGKTMATKNNATSVQFSSQPRILEREEFVNIELNGMTSQLMEPNKPVLPIFIKTYQLPFGSKSITVTCTPKDINTITLTKKVISARIAPLSKMNQITTSIKDMSVYNSTAFYPSSWYRCDIGAGRDENGSEIIFVKIVCYPVRYSPGNNQIDNFF
jgi:PBP1b-binding outer membrane lipoprotein LpoB